MTNPLLNFFFGLRTKKKGKEEGKNSARPVRWVRTSDDPKNTTWRICYEDEVDKVLAYEHAVKELYEKQK